MFIKIMCSWCHGRGKDYFDGPSCKRCDGRGQIWKDVEKVQSIGLLIYNGMIVDPDNYEIKEDEVVIHDPEVRVDQDDRLIFWTPFPSK